MVEEKTYEKNNCANCGNTFHGHYCNACGQKVIKRFTGIYLWHRFSEDIIGIESGLFRTWRELWLSPGKMISNYIGGATSRYYGPLKYLLFWTALYLLSLLFVKGADHNFDVLQYLPLGINKLLQSESSQETVAFLLRTMQEQTNFYLIGMIPIFSMFGLLFFKGKGFNLTELVIFYTYFCGQFAFCGLMTNLLNVVPMVKETMLPFLILFALYYFIFFRMQTLFFDLRFGTSLLKGTGIILASLGVYWTVLVLLFNLVMR